MSFSNTVELRTYCLEGLVQVQCPHAYLVTAHLIHTIRLHVFVGLGVEQHARHAMLLVSAGELRFLVFHVGEDLVQVAGVDALPVELLLRRVTVVLRVDDEDGPASCERYVGVHGGEHVIEAVVERPADVRRPRGKLWVLTSVVLKDELLVQVAHSLLVEEVHHAETPALPRLEKALHDQPAHVHEHAISLVVPVEAHVPVFARKVHVFHVHEVRKQPSKCLLARLVDVRANQEHDRRLEDAVRARVRAELVVAANQLPAQNRARLQGFGQLNLAPR